jgi:DNA invertase Pin-like site-specific DNA recombinase
VISATENIDETPAGGLMHGMLASFSEYYRRNLAAEVVKGATQKAKRGGTPGIAPLGYLNVIQRIDGRDVRTVALDPERAPLVRWAFETYATGDYSLNDLVELLESRGLRSRANRRDAKNDEGPDNSGPEPVEALADEGEIHLRLSSTFDARSDPGGPGPYVDGSIRRKTMGAAGFEPATSRV